MARERIKREEGRKVEGTKSLSETNGELVELVKKSKAKASTNWWTCKSLWLKKNSKYT